jgi:hypothetical protein
VRSYGIAEIDGDKWGRASSTRSTRGTGSRIARSPAADELACLRAAEAAAREAERRERLAERVAESIARVGYWNPNWRGDADRRRADAER